jgi:alginate O-acetyltransferase complex protein AlgI
MDSASFQFVLFGLAVALMSNFSRSPVWRSAVLLLSSFLFLGLLAHNPAIFVPLAGFLLLGYLGLELIQRGWTKFTTLSICIVIFAFLWLKKYTILPPQIFLHVPYFTLGISYIFFRILHLLIESGQGTEKHKVGLGAYLTYTLNFTTFVSGPIQRYDEFAKDQFAKEPIPLTIADVGLQLARIVLGFFKVNVMALLFNMVRDDSLAELTQPVSSGAKLFACFKLAVVYPFFLYCNFSGYIDIVIALARLMRVRLPENFDRPFSATSFLDFWNRWHITLSTWLKTYVYNPLLLNLMRRFESPGAAPFLGVISFFVTFFLIGLWHGRTSEFILFGILQGGGVAINKLWQVWLTKQLGRKGYRSLSANPVYEAFGRGLTFSWFAFTLFWFWSGWKQIDTIYSSIGAGKWIAVWLAVWLVATLVLAAWERVRESLLAIRVADIPVLTHRYARVVYITALAVVAFVMTALLNQPAPDIVYKAF